MTFHGKDFSKVLKYMYIPRDGDTTKSKSSHSMVVSPLPGPEGKRAERPRSHEELAKIAAYFCVENKKRQISTNGNSNLSEFRLKQIAAMFCVESQEQAIIRRMGNTETRLGKIAAMFCVESPEQAVIRHNLDGKVTKEQSNDCKEKKSKRNMLGLVRTLTQCLIGH